MREVREDNGSENCLKIHSTHSDHVSIGVETPIMRCFKQKSLFMTTVQPFQQNRVCVFNQELDLQINNSM